MMVVDVYVATHLELEINKGVSRKECQHVIKEGNSRFNPGHPRPIEIEGEGDTGLCGIAGLLRAPRGY